MYKLLEKALTIINNKKIEKCNIKYENKKMKLCFNNNGYEYLYQLYYYNDLTICELVEMKQQEQ